MHSFIMMQAKRLLPLLLAGLLIATAFGFVRYYNAYQAPGEHWAPASPVAHEMARFTTDMGNAGDFHVTIEKLESKFPLFFVEYQRPGRVLELSVHSDDGIVRLDQQFADEGRYRITVQHIIHPMHQEVVDFTVQTPLVKYANDLLLGCLLLAAGFLSGHRLRALAMITLVVSIGNLASPQPALAHGDAMASVAAVMFPANIDAVAVHWLAGKPPVGEANRAPLDWRMQITRDGQAVKRAPFALDVVHGESHLPVLHIEGVANGGLIDLRYSPPDGAHYAFELRTVIDGKAYHLSLPGSAAAVPPTLWRKWQSFLIMMVPLLIGMVWGWKRG